MTGREKEVYCYIVAYRKEHSYSPTLREIGAGVNLKSPSSVHRYVTALVSKGYLEVHQDKIRTIVPVNEDALLQRINP